MEPNLETIVYRLHYVKKINLIIEDNKIAFVLSKVCF